MDKVVVLRAQDGLSFVADACSALAEAVSEIRVAKRSEPDLLDVYTELVVAYVRLSRPRLLAQQEAVRVAILDHLMERLAQAQDGAIRLPVIDIVDRLHGELEREHAIA